MKGTRPLTNAEIRKVRDAFAGTYASRNRGFFMLGVSIGGRVSELLSLTVGDVWQNAQPVTDFQFNKNIVKGGETARTIPVNSDGRAAIENIIKWHQAHFQSLHRENPLFPSRKGGSMKRQAIHKILEKAFIDAGLNGKLATHTLRKTFAQRLYEKSNDIFLVKELLGHKNVATTQAYIGVNYVTAQTAVEAMSLHAEDQGIDPFEEVATVELINALIRRGYTVASLSTGRAFLEETDPSSLDEG